MKQQLSLITQDKIENIIFIVRGKKIMFDKDLAELYGATTGTLMQSVKRNIQRFPSDFMFQLNPREYTALKSHFVISKGRGGTRKSPYAFTEHGILMLSSVLNSDKAIEVNIQIMRTFTTLKELMLVHKNLRIKIEELEKKYDSQFKIVFNALRKLIDPPQKPKISIGFIIPPKKIE